jgi:hypothetical protein
MGLAWEDDLESSMKPSDRTSLIRLAHSLPKGSEERRAILSSLKEAAREGLVPKAASREPKTIVIRGPARALGKRDLAGILLPFPGRNYPSLSTTGPQDTRSEAMAEAKALAQGYTRQTWPGGMAEIVALVHFPDHPHSDGGGEGSWAGVVNTFYSFS